MCCAAKAIGNSELEAKFTEGIIWKFFLPKKTKILFLGTQKIKRDIIFAASLYL